MLLDFNLYCGTYRYELRKVSINPAYVLGVQEDEIRPPDSGVQKVAHIKMADGTGYTVEDSNRSAAVRIAMAQGLPAHA